MNRLHYGANDGLDSNSRINNNRNVGLQAMNDAVNANWSNIESTSNNFDIDSYEQRLVSAIIPNENENENNVLSAVQAVVKKKIYI